MAQRCAYIRGDLTGITDMDNISKSLKSDFADSIGEYVVLLLIVGSNILS